MEISPPTLEYADLVCIENCLWILTANTGTSNYDFGFEQFFPLQRPSYIPESCRVIARIGAIPHYQTVFASLQSDGITLIHTPDQYLAATELPHWYPRLDGFTPKSMWFDGPPNIDLVEAELGWPIFMKGSRQTSRHKRSLSIIHGPDQMRQALAEYATDPILRSQRIVCREFVRLRIVDDANQERIPSSFEFRTFWWRGQLVGCGRYWWDGNSYRMTAEESVESLALAAKAAQQMNLPFLVVDVAQTVDGRWIVIECNDGQESGYASIPPISLWQKIIDIEKKSG